jgi:UDP-N-acetylglucosamine diphosphorylase/glucosamine-1-phosphate N-acetyltransferase
MSNEVIVVIMAGGLGKRMGSSLPKVLHKINNAPMICHVLYNAIILNCNIKKILIVVGKYKDEIKEVIDKEMINFFIPPMFTHRLGSSVLKYVDQPEPLGTGHAIRCCIPELSTYPDVKVLILSGDVPLLSIQTMWNILNSSSSVRLVVTKMKDPTGYGRILLTSDSKFNKIIEQKDCNDEEVKIGLVNCGIYVIHSKFILKYSSRLTNTNAQKEYYLTDIIEIIKDQEKINIDLFNVPESNQFEIMGVNTIEQLKELEALYQRKMK